VAARTRSAWWRRRKSRLLQLWTAGALVSLLVTGASALGYLEPLQTRAVDLLLFLRGARFPSTVVIVAIDDDAFESLGRRQPLPRSYLASLVRGLQRSGAAVVGLDVQLTSPTTAPEDAALAQGIQDFADSGLSRVVLVDALMSGPGPLAEPALASRVLRGSSLVPRDRDGVIRSAAFCITRDKHPPEPAFSLAVLARLGGTGPDALARACRRPTEPLALSVWRAEGDWEAAPQAPLAPGAGLLWRINVVGPSGSFLTIPASAVAPLGEPGAEVAADNPLRGRIVLVGGTFRESRDVYPTPRGQLSGVELHANLVHMLATRSFVRPSGWAVSLAVQLFVVLLTGVVLSLVRPLVGTLACVAIALVVGIPGSYLAFRQGGYWVDFLLPVLSVCALGLWANALTRRRARTALSRYVGREVMTRVLAEDPALAGSRREVSILASDLRGFTPLCERLPAEAVAARLNEYFGAMTTVIFAHAGTISDFVGDAILAIFGAPTADPDHALHAVQSALAMDRALHRLNSRWEGEGLPPLRMGIGIHTGQVFAGNVGGPKRLKYAVVGDPVNVAARVEGLTKELDASVLVTEETRRLLGERLAVKDRGAIIVKGRTDPVHVYEVLAVEPRPRMGGA
jgi:adenylate cyclase